MPIPFKVAFEYRYGRRTLGLAAAPAMRRARLRYEFDTCPHVRLTHEPDPEPYDHGDCGNEAETNAMIEDQGVWGIVGQVQCPCCDQWRTVDSVWGCIGTSETGYEDDIMTACLEAAREQCQCADHELISAQAHDEWAEFQADHDGTEDK